jgi:hypothetical protein
MLSTVPVYSAEYKDPVKPVLLPPSLRNVRNQAYDSASDDALAGYCSGLVEKAAMTAEQAEKVERETRDQQNSPAWYAYRAGRITATQMHSVFRFNIANPAISTVKSVVYPGRKINNDAVRWGIQHEEQACKNYVKAVEHEHHGLHVEKCGFFVNPRCPYMGASPDRIVTCVCCGRGCLEVKCPYKHRGVSVKEAAHKDKDFCLGLSADGELYLKKEHPYYTQVQCQLLVTDLEYCDFVVWTSDDFDVAVVRIELDFVFAEQHRLKAETFFKLVALPELVAKRFTAKITTSSSKRKMPLNDVSNASRVNASSSSSTSKKTKTVWCHCRREEDFDDMVACDEPTCPVQWYHVSCVGLEQLPQADETWFCEKCLK